MYKDPHPSHHNNEIMIREFTSYASLFLARSAQLDPDFWAKGWDWSAGANDLARQAMFLLSSGIFEWDILTNNGWQSINIGDWIKVNNVKLDFGDYGGCGVDRFSGAMVMYIDPSLGTNIFDIAALITHEATHLLLNEGGWRPYLGAEKAATNAMMVTATLRQQEIWATGMMLDLFGDKLSPLLLKGANDYMNYWKNASIWPGW